MKKKFETLAIRTQSPRSENKEHSVPLYLTSGFVFDDSEEMRASFAGEKERNIYGRYSNPNTSEFIEKMCLLEGADAGFAYATGMSAIFSTFAALLSSGDHLISCRSIFGTTTKIFDNYFPKWGIETSYFLVDRIDTIEQMIRPSTKILYIETPTNPGVAVLDLEIIGGLAKKHGLLFIVDNCFATPYLQQPIQYGADLVIHSATKLIDGQGRVLGGVTVGSEDLMKEVYLFSRSTGPAMSPFNAWILSKSLETLAVRVDRQSMHAMALAEFLERRPEVNWVRYPFLKSHPQFAIAQKQMRCGGTLVTFELQGGIQAGKRFLDAVRLCSLTANLGDSRTIVTHPISSTHASMQEKDRLESGITEGMIRCSLGLEHIDDIKGDFLQALQAINPQSPKLG